MRIHDKENEPKDYCRKCENKMLKKHQKENNVIEFGSEHLDYSEDSIIYCDNCGKLLTSKDN